MHDLMRSEYTFAQHQSHILQLDDTSYVFLMDASDARKQGLGRVWGQGTDAEGHSSAAALGGGRVQSLHRKMSNQMINQLLLATFMLSH